MVRAIYDFARVGELKDNILQAFFSAIGLPLNKPGDIDFSTMEVEDNILAKLTRFANYLINNFFLPYKLPLSYYSKIRLTPVSKSIN